MTITCPACCVSFASISMISPLTLCECGQCGYQWFPITGTNDDRLKQQGYFFNHAGRSKDQRTITKQFLSAKPTNIHLETEGIAKEKSA